MTSNFDHKARTSRRNVLAFLGLAGVTAPALQTEALALDQGGGPNYTAENAKAYPQVAQQVSIRACAHALRQLADGLESGRVIPEGLDVKSSLGRETDWLNQELRFAFYLTPEGNERPVNQDDGFEWLDDRNSREAIEAALAQSVKRLQAAMDDMAAMAAHYPSPACKPSINLSNAVNDVLREIDNRHLALVKLV